MIEEKDLTNNILKENIKKILDDKKTYLEYKAKLQKSIKKDASTLIYEYIKKEK